MITIHAPELRKEAGRAYLEASVQGLTRTDRLWFSVPEAFGDGLSAAGADPFVLAVLPIAMHSRQDIAIRGSLSERLFYHLSRHYMPLLETSCPG